MNGEIAAYSQVAHGTQIVFTLPLELPSEGHQFTAGDEHTAIAQKKNTELRKIVFEKALIVDDSATNRKMLGIFLRKQGIPFEEAFDGAAAVSAFKGNTFDLVFMDVSMPVMNGLEASRQIRRFESQHRVVSCPIIGVTAHATPDDEKACLEAGMNLHLPKPLRPAAIEQALSCL